MLKGKKIVLIGPGVMAEALLLALLSRPVWQPKT